MTPTMTDEQLAKAMIDPASVFANPMTIVAEDSISDELKIELLRHWEYDAREIQVAEEEGFPPRPSTALLDEVIAALHELGTGPDTEHPAMTKQGGV
jgi:hypothetical protein